MNEQARRTHELADARAQMFIELFERGEPSKHIVKVMGWETKYPSQRVQLYVKKLRERGYTLGKRGCKSAN